MKACSISRTISDSRAWASRSSAWATAATSAGGASAPRTGTSVA
jgi:hypothetical protein